MLLSRGFIFSRWSLVLLRISRSPSHKNHIGKDVDFIGSCNGLICLPRSTKLFLWNKSTGEYCSIQLPRADRNLYDFFNSGSGYDAGKSLTTKHCHINTEKQKTWSLVVLSNDWPGGLVPREQIPMYYFLSTSQPRCLRKLHCRKTAAVGGAVFWDRSETALQQHAQEKNVLINTQGDGKQEMDKKESYCGGTEETFSLLNYFLFPRNPAAPSWLSFLNCGATEDCKKYSISIWYRSLQSLGSEDLFRHPRIYKCLPDGLTRKNIVFYIYSCSSSHGSFCNKSDKLKVIHYIMILTLLKLEQFLL